MGLRPEDWPNVISKDRAWEVLSPWRTMLCEPFVSGWNAFWKWKDVDPEWYATIVPRTRAGIVHDYAVKNAKSVFEGKDGVRVRSEFDSVLLIFGDDLVARLKKFDSRERASNSGTSRQALFDRQYLNLPGIDAKATKVTVGYTLNEPQTEIIKISVSCWCVNTKKWVLSLYDAAEGGTLFDVPVTTPDNDDAPKPIIRPKVGDKTAEGQTG